MLHRIARVTLIAVAALVVLATTSTAASPQRQSSDEPAGPRPATLHRSSSATVATEPGGAVDRVDRGRGVAAGLDAAAGEHISSGEELLSFASARIEDRVVERAPAPVGLSIGVLDVAAPVVRAGAGADGAMEVPSGIHDVAWYEFGPSPGEAGSAVLAAHVDMAGRGLGVFFELDELAAGDLVTVAYADGSERAFEVVETHRYRKDELDTGRIFDRNGPATLTLVTCGGGFNPSLRRYDSNVVVYAAPVSDGYSQ